MKSLQEQVQNFRGVIQALETTAAGSNADDFLFTTLSRAQEISDEVDRLITAGNESRGARYKLWLKKKLKIVRPGENIRDAQDALGLALNVDILSVIASPSGCSKPRLTRKSRSSTRRVESALTIIQQANDCRSMVRSFDQRLRNIENALGSRQSGQVDCQALPKLTTVGFLKRSRSQDADTDTVSAKHTRALWLPQKQLEARVPDSPLARWAAPTSPFETRVSFRPEVYTVLEGFAKLFCIDYREFQETEYTRVEHCSMFYSPAPRQWLRLGLSITTSVDSQYWKLNRAKVVSYAVSRPNPLPALLNSVLQAFLISREKLTQNSHISVYLGTTPGRDKSDGNEATRIPIRVTQPTFRFLKYLQDITRMVYHWNCPRYWEEHLIVRPLYRRKPSYYFMACIDSRWVHYLRFSTHEAQIDEALYVMRALHCQEGAPGIAPFIGVVLDENGIINGFLSEAPTNGRLFDTITCSGTPIAWQQREKWCRQILQAVAEMHSKNFVVGMLGNVHASGLGLDAENNLVIFNRFWTTFAYDDTKKGIVPPELRQSASIVGSMTALPHTDIYQLGLLLWRIAANRQYQTISAFCKLAGCTTKANACTEPHSDPVQLPSPGEDTPRYLRDMIVACRAENPDERLAAWELLKMFPPMAEEMTSTKKAALDAKDQPIEEEPVCNRGGASKKPQRPRQLAQYQLKVFTRPEECHERFEAWEFCDRCGDPTGGHSFHCAICVSANFDLCPKCVSQGEHCLDDDHYLREFLVGSQEEKYYSSVKDTGQREVITP